MGCGCEEAAKLGNVGEKHVLAYTGGTALNFYLLFQRTLSSCKPGECGMPVVLDNGDIEYPQGEPPDILAYERRGPRLFRPKWKPCPWRVTQVTYPEGCLTIEVRCIKRDNCSVCPSI